MVELWAQKCLMSSFLSNVISILSISFLRAQVSGAEVTTGLTTGLHSLSFDFLVVLCFQHGLIYIMFRFLRRDLLCGLVVRVPGCRSRGPGFIPGATTFSEK
jgi:hypothetical protein